MCSGKFALSGIKGEDSTVSGSHASAVYSAYLSLLWRADERTRTALLLQLRVFGRASQGLARGCKSRIFRRLSLLPVAAYCTVLRSRWRQNGISGSCARAQFFTIPSSREGPASGPSFRGQR